MKYLINILIIFLFFFTKSVYASSDVCQGKTPSSADLTSTTQVGASEYLYVPIIFSYDNFIKDCKSEPGKITFEAIFYAALVNTFEKSNTACSLSDISSCKRANYIYSKHISSQKNFPNWNGNAIQEYYPNLLILTDLDYSVTINNTPNFNWNAVQPNTWSALPDTFSSNMLQENISYPCGYNSNNSFKIGGTNTDFVNSNRAQELSYFCYPGVEGYFAGNTYQSYLNKSFDTTLIPPMLFPVSRNTYLSPNNAPASTMGGSLNKNSCEVTNAYSDAFSDSSVSYWGFPFRGQACEDTKLENLYFMIVEEVD